MFTYHLRRAFWSYISGSQEPSTPRKIASLVIIFLVFVGGTIFGILMEEPVTRFISEQILNIHPQVSAELITTLVIPNNRTILLSNDYPIESDYIINRILGNNYQNPYFTLLGTPIQQLNFSMFNESFCSKSILMSAGGKRGEKRPVGISQYYDIEMLNKGKPFYYHLLRITNTGNALIENFRMKICFSGNVATIGDYSNTVEISRGSNGDCLHGQSDLLAPEDSMEHLFYLSSDAERNEITPDSIFQNVEISYYTNEKLYHKRNYFEEHRFWYIFHISIQNCELMDYGLIPFTLNISVGNETGRIRFYRS